MSKPQQACKWRYCQLHSNDVSNLLLIMKVSRPEVDIFKYLCLLLLEERWTEWGGRGGQNEIGDHDKGIGGLNMYKEEGGFRSV